MTDLQWERYRKSLKGTRLQNWKVVVLAVSKSGFVQTKTTEGCGVNFELSDKDLAASLQKDSYILVSGDVREVAKFLFDTDIALVDGSVEIRR